MRRFFALVAACLPAGIAACDYLPGVGPDEQDRPPAARITLPVVSIAVASGHTCAVSADGSASCWGANNGGQHGNGTRTAVPYPTRVRFPGHLAEIHAFGTMRTPEAPRTTDPPRNAFTCALDPEGMPYSWGSQRNWQLGTGPLSGPARGAALRTPPQRPQADTPIAVPGGPFRSMTVGNEHGCALGIDGRLRCWGSWTLHDSIQSTPAVVPGGPHGFTEIAAGGRQTCGLTEAGRTFCWGRNRWGVVDPAAPGLRKIVSELTEVAAGLTFRRIAVGYMHACGLTADGTAYCWGRNDFGQLGTGRADRVCKDQLNTFTCPDTTGPEPVVGDQAFVSLTAGQLHTCGLTDEGRAYCWGGRGLVVPGSFVFRPEPVETDVRFSELEAGARHVCGIGTDGRAYCWGLNRWGQLGTGSTENVSTPTPIRGQP